LNVKFRKEDMISYAQNGEDVILNRIFGDQETGFYIDIGASHPELLSVTKHFYDRGWSGVNVDPLRQSIELFNKERPRDINLQNAIALEGGLRDFFEVIDYPELSTLNGDVISNYENKSTAYKVEVMSGNQLFSEYVNTPVDFMKVDVEGGEYEVIKSIDFRRYRPKVLVIEATIPNAKFPGWAEIASLGSFAVWEPLLLEGGYVFAYFDGLNRFYVSEEHLDFLKFFPFGLCLWDNYLLHSQTKQIRDLNRQCEERAKQVEILTSRIAELDWHCEERLKQIIELTAIINRP